MQVQLVKDYLKGVVAQESQVLLLKQLSHGYTHGLQVSFPSSQNPGSHSQVDPDLFPSEQLVQFVEFPLQTRHL